MCDCEFICKYCNAEHATYERLETHWCKVSDVISCPFYTNPIDQDTRFCFKCKEIVK